MRHPRELEGAVRELGLFTYVGIQAHFIVILYVLSNTYRVVKNHSLGSTPVQNVAGIKGRVLHYRMMFQFGMVR